MAKRVCASHDDFDIRIEQKLEKKQMMERTACAVVTNATHFACKNAVFGFVLIWFLSVATLSATAIAPIPLRLVNLLSRYPNERRRRTLVKKSDDGNEHKTNAVKLNMLNLIVNKQRKDFINAQNET